LLNHEDFVGVGSKYDINSYNGTTLIKVKNWSSATSSVLMLL